MSSSLGKTLVITEDLPKLANFEHLFSITGCASKADHLAENVGQCFIKINICKSNPCQGKNL